MNTHAGKPSAPLHVHLVLHILDYFRVSSVIYNEKLIKFPYLRTEFWFQNIS